MKTLMEYILFNLKMSDQCCGRTKDEEILNVIPMFAGSLAQKHRDLILFLEKIIIPFRFH